MNCPNCGCARFKKNSPAPSNIVVTAQVEVGKCPPSGCGKIVVYAAA